jgi:hypothetical protein
MKRRVKAHIKGFVREAIAIVIIDDFGNVEEIEDILEVEDIEECEVKEIIY